MKIIKTLFLIVPAFFAVSAAYAGACAGAPSDCQKFEATVPVKGITKGYIFTCPDNNLPYAWGIEYYSDKSIWVPSWGWTPIGGDSPRKAIELDMMYVGSGHATVRVELGCSATRSTKGSPNVG